MIKALLISVVLAAQAAPAAPAFEFREFKSSLTLSAAQDQGLVYRNTRMVDFCQATSMRDVPITVCPFSEASLGRGIAGEDLLSALTGFDADGLVFVSMTVDGGSVPAVSAAMTAKFGEPCRSNVREWRNAAGAVLQNPTSTWCLADGTLEVRARGDDARQGQVRFVVSRISERPPAAPRVDF